MANKSNKQNRSLVHMSADTLVKLATQPVECANSSIKYVRVSVPVESEAEEKIMSNFGEMAEEIEPKDGKTHFFFPCMYRSLVMDIDFFASVTSNYTWGDDVEFSLEKGVEV